MKVQTSYIDDGNRTSPDGDALLPGWVTEALTEPHPSSGAENVREVHDEQW